MRINLESPTGTTQSLENALRSLDGRIDTIKALLEKLSEDSKKLTDIINTPFEKQDELDKTAVRNNEIMAELAPKEYENGNTIEEEVRIRIVFK